MAATAPVPVMRPNEDYYQPITTPPGGLLASAVGTPQAPLPPIDPKVYEDDSAVNTMNRITSSNSDYMKLAETAGLQQANKRGLLNSSMAVGSAQAEAYKAAAPLAMQDAQAAAGRNQVRLSAGFEGERQQADITSREGMLATTIASEEARLGRQLTSNELQQQRDIASRYELQGRDIASQTSLQANSLAAQERIAQAGIQAESERLGRQLSAAEVQQQRDLASRSSLLGTELTSRETLARESLVADAERQAMTEQGATSRANLDAATRTRLAELENLSQEQVATLSYYTANNEIYARSVASIYSNENIPAPARDQAMQLFGSLRNSGVNIPATVFGTNLSWGGSAPAGGTPAPGTAPTGLEPIAPPPPPAAGLYPTTSLAQIEAMRNDGIVGNAQSAASAYNTWAAANGVAPTQVQMTPNAKSGFFDDGPGQYSGVGLIKGLLG